MSSPHLTLFDTPAHARMTAQQYIDSPQSECKSDLIEGVFVMASPASYRHEDLSGFILTTLRYFVESKRLGKVTGPNTAYRLSRDNVYQPDVSFVRSERLHLSGEVVFDGPPDIAVEVVSPSSRQYDLVEKKVNYARFGVIEYWLIDLVDRQATFFAQSDGHFLPIPAPEGELRSQLLDGFFLRHEWLFPAPGSDLPLIPDIIRQLGLP